MDVTLENVNHLKQLLADAKKEIAQWQSKYESLLEMFRLAKQRQFAASSEHHVLQDDLFDEPDAVIASETSSTETGDIEVAAHTRKTHPKRTPLPEHLPRERQVYDIPESEKQCDCGHEKVRIGESVSEQLEVIPPSFKVMQHVRPKYACRHCQMGVNIAPMPKLLLPKSIAGPGFVAYTITAKYLDHLPLYRQEQIWTRYGVDIPRNTLCDWLMKTAELCEPLWDLLGEHIVSNNYIQADETPVQVLNETDRYNQQKSYMWVYRGGCDDQMATYFAYEATRSGQHAKAFLQDFRGYLQTDGYSGYAWTDDHPHITHLACMAHARRPFTELVKLSKKTGKSHEAIKRIGQLYQVEEAIRDLPPEERYRLRQEKAKPLLDKMKDWLEQSIQKSPPKGKLGKAIHYMLDRWEQLNHYLLDGRLHIDNNLIENDIRLFALGKKNWLCVSRRRCNNEILLAK